MAKNIIDELFGYRVRVERDGREVVNIPGILALPSLLVAPKMSIIGMVAAPLLGCKIHLENEDGTKVDVGMKAREAAETIVDTAKKTAKTIREEVDKAWESMSDDDSAEETESDDAENTQENEDGQEAAPDNAAETAAENLKDIVEELEKTDDVPTIEVKSDDSAKA